MPAKNPWQHEVVHLNNKGLDLIHPIEQVDAEHYSRMEDVKSLQEGTITPRPGTSLINAVAFDTTGLAAGTVLESGSGCGVASQSIISSSSSDTYGSYVTVLAVTSRISKYWIINMVLGSGSPDRDTYASFDVSFDAGAGPEVNFLEGHTSRHERKSSAPYTTGDTVEFPFEIASGSRIRIRVKDDTAAAITYSFTLQMVG